MELVDIVIPLGNGSKWRDNELRYALRSIEKHCKNYKDIYIIGNYPDFINNKIKYIPYFAPYTFRTDDIKNKILVACNTKEISDNFLFTNDDIFLLENIDAVNYPYYFDKKISEVINRRKFDSYRISLEDTQKILIKNNLNTKHFDIHFPIIYNKQKFKDIIYQYDWTQQYGYIIKSLYCNNLNIEGKLYSDNKIKNRSNGSLIMTENELNKFLLGKDVFSTNDDINETIRRKLKELYPNKSKYEK